MTPAKTADAILEFAAQVRQLSPPPALNSPPDRFFERRSELVRGLVELAERIDPASRFRASAAVRERPAVRATEQRIINGKRIMVQVRRMAFALSPAGADGRW
jgi:hypothetical protein